MEAPKTVEEYMALNGKKALLHDLEYIKSLPGVFETSMGGLDAARWKYRILPRIFFWFGREVTLVVLTDKMLESNAVFCAELLFVFISFEWIKEVID